MTPLLEVADVSVRFPVRTRLIGRAQSLIAVDGVDLDLDKGQSMGVVGESGCGKSTLARVIVGATSATTGVVRFQGTDLSNHRAGYLRRAIQMVFQDPGSSLNPAFTVRHTLTELLRFHHLRAGKGIETRCIELMDLVRLPVATLDVRPRSLSGGQRQRVAIARALAVEPSVVVADEPVAALDVSVQGAILTLFNDLRRDLGISLIFISHDLAVVRHVCDRVAVMYLGKVVEEAGVDSIFQDPQHPYTRALLNAVPSLTGSAQLGASGLTGEPPSQLAIPDGCRFHPRCPVRIEICSTQQPERTGTEHQVRCFLAASNSTVPSVVS